jgi:hypothetical protein
MDESGQQKGSERREGTRKALREPVSVRLLAPCLDGVGENVSEQGVLFVVEGPVEVMVRIGNSGTELRGTLVRLQDMGGGRSGIAVRFDAPCKP